MARLARTMTRTTAITKAMATRALSLSPRLFCSELKSGCNSNLGYLCELGNFPGPPPDGRVPLFT